MTRESPSETFRAVGPGYKWTPVWLRPVRLRPNRRRSALVTAAILGPSIAWFHWFGLVVGGTLVGLSSRSVRTAVAGGVGFGALVLAVHVLASPVMGPVEFVGLTPLSVVSIATALVAPLWGSLVRAVV